MFNLSVLKTVATKTLKHSGLILKRFSPEILTGAGVVGVVVGTVFACKATLKVYEVVGEAKADIDSIHDTRTNYPVKYSEEDSRKDLIQVYTKTAVKVVRLYGPAALIGTFSIGCILGGHHILRKENAAITAAYMGLSEAFKKYRQRVIADVGEEKEKEYRYGVTKELVEVTDDDGNKSYVEHTVVDPSKLSPYVKFFDVGNPNWQKNHDANLRFLMFQQNSANDYLHANGHIFLNEVYDMLKLPRTEAGQYVGWVDGEGDGFVDFGIFNGAVSANRDFVNGYENAILLDFNVDGIIMDIFNKKAHREKMRDNK